LFQQRRRKIWNQLPSSNFDRICISEGYASSLPLPPTIPMHGVGLKRKHLWVTLSLSIGSLLGLLFLTISLYSKNINFPHMAWYFAVDTPLKGVNSKITTRNLESTLLILYYPLLLYDTLFTLASYISYPSLLPYQTDVLRLQTLFFKTSWTETRIHPDLL
jgi:hypothetical protein